MGRDKKDSISVATTRDIRDVMALAKEDWGLEINLNVHFNAVLNRMIISASCGFVLDTGEEYYIYDDHVSKTGDLPFATACYRLVTIVYHRVDAVLAGNPNRRDRPL